MSHSGIIHTDSDNHLLSLHLERVKAQINVLDVSALVTLRQTFRNTAKHATSRAKYVFPIPARASICGFEMIGENGRLISGIAKDAEKAKLEYNAALDQNKKAALVEMATRDLFVISIGSIPGDQRVETKLTYVQSLVNNDNIDEIRLQIPFYIAERYGKPIAKTADATAAPAVCRVKIKVDVQTSGALLKVSSPSHSDSITTSRPRVKRLGRLSRRRMTVKHRSDTYLDRDFVLIVQALGLDAPRCFAEMKYETTRSCTLALQMVLIPKLDLPSVPREYIFLIDRSGSMSGDPMDTAKRTLCLLLHMLPKDGSTFNVISFDNDVEKLWPVSGAYSQITLDEAKRFVDKISPRGGTELYLAIKTALGTIDNHAPTSIFVLTDGQVTDDLQECVTAVTEAVASAPQDRPIRVYTLGIGRHVSQAFCDGVALAGRGEALYATFPEYMIPKCARLLQAARSPTMKNVTVDWNVAFPATSPSVAFEKRIPPVQQSPRDIIDLHAGSRIHIFAIITLPSPTAPKEVILRGTLDDDGSEYFITVPIRGVDLPVRLPMVHTLAATHLIRDLEIPQVPLQVITDSDAQESRKAAIIHLGIKYQLASSYTSFVAVESETDRHRKRFRRLRGRRQPRSTDPTRTGTTARSSPGLGSQIVTSIAQGLTSLLTPTSPPPTPSRRLPDGETPPGGWPFPTTTPSVPTIVPRSSNASSTTIDTMSSLISSSTASSESDGSRSSVEDPIPRSPSPTIRNAPVSNADGEASSSERPPPRLNENIAELMMSQSYDGSFEPSALVPLVGQEVIDDVEQLVQDPLIRATVLAVVYIHKVMGYSELCQQLTNKALTYLKQQYQDDEASLQGVMEQVSAIVI